MNYRRMVREAEAAGFNPLTALRNGGAAGFSVSTSTGSAPLSSRIADGVAGAMGTLAQDESFLAHFDPYVDNMREARYDLIRAQVANLDASTKAVLQSAANVERRGSGVAGRLSRGAVSDVSGAPQAVEAGQPTVTNPWQSAWVDPATRDADAFEQRYGDSEVAQMLYGLNVAANDVRASVNRWMREGEPLVKRTKLPPEEKSWWPSLSINWR